ncbi:MAG: rhodanese-like domain-containing protein [Isosphaeraceae bacterium]
MGEPIDLIDVRTPAEFREVHAECAGLVPLDSLDPRAVVESRNGDQDRALYAIWQSRAAGAGRRPRSSRRAAIPTSSASKRYDGLGASRPAGDPREKTISLERQVRIAAGSLVLIGTVLGAFVHPAFLGLSGFVGAGLLFAGVTDTCGMAMMLAKMPWNQAGGECSR